MISGSCLLPGRYSISPAGWNRRSLPGCESTGCLACLVERIPELAGAAAAVRQHHERWDGTGYASGLSAEGAALSARIVGAADVFDSLVMVRPNDASGHRLMRLMRSAGAAARISTPVWCGPWSPS